MSQPSTWSLQQMVNGMPSCVYAIPDLPLISIGSSPASNLVLDDADISSLHAVLVSEDSGTLTISSQSQTGGVWINDQPVTEQDLCHGDILRLGGMTFQVIGHSPQTDSSLDTTALAGAVSPQADMADMAGNRPKRRMAMFVGAAIMLLLVLGWLVIQEVAAWNAKMAVNSKSFSLTSQVMTLQQSFAQGTDVSQSARDLRASDDFKALPENDPFRTELDQLIQQHQVWLELRAQIDALSQQQLALKPADDATVAEIKQRLANVSLPPGIQQELTQQLDLLLTEQQGMRQIFAVRDKGVDEQRRGEEKLRLEAIANNLARAEVRTGMQKVVEQLFPKGVAAETKSAQRPLPQEKPEPPPIHNIQQP